MTETIATKPEKKKETFGEMITSFLFMIFLALLFRSFVYEPFHIPSGSMLSTLYKGDYVFVSKFSYGYSKYSLPLDPPIIDGRIMASQPKRGDVVVFWEPHANENYIKRLIGLPGDTIQMQHGRLYINGEMVEQVRDGEVIIPDDNGEEHPVVRYMETLPGGKKHIVLDDIEGTPQDDTKIYTVPEGHYFMMGDNRDHSQDSRFQNAVGYVPFENLIGRAEIIAFSWSGKSGRWFKVIE